MNYNLNGKNIRVPDSEINKSMNVLGITKEEAIQLWLEDEGYLENEEVEALTEKAKENKVKHEAKATTPKKAVKRERKPDEEKEYLIRLLTACLENNNYTVNVTNKSKIIEFSIGENHYKLDLIKQRPPKS